MTARVSALLLGVACGVLLPTGAPAKDKPPAFHVASITFREGGRLGDTLPACDVTGIVTDAIQEKKSTTGKSTELVLRIDRVSKLRGRPPPGPAAAGTELGLTLLAVGSKPMDQPFLCRKFSLMQASEASHCARLEKCSATIAEQMSTWLSAKPN